MAYLAILLHDNQEDQSGPASVIHIAPRLVLRRSTAPITEPAIDAV